MRAGRTHVPRAPRMALQLCAVWRKAEQVTDFIRRNLTAISLALSVLSGFVTAYNFGFWRGNAHERFWQDMYEACEERRNK